jgi:hypothetical protein
MPDQNQTPLTQTISAPGVSTAIPSSNPTPFLAQKEQDYINASVEAGTKTRQLIKNYSSYTAMSKQQRASFVKNPNIPADKLQPYDRLQNSLWRWRQMVEKQGSKLSGDQKQKAAENYYNALIAPTYKEMGMDPMPKELWMQQAFSGALNYDPEAHAVYSNSLWKGFLTGAVKGEASLERLGAIGIDELGHTITSESMGGDQSWENWHNNYQSHGESHFEAIQKAAQEIPVLGYISKAVHNLASNDQFYADAMPAQNYTEAATSGIVEQVVQLPLYEGIGSALKVTGQIAAKAIPAVKNLTKVLDATAAGRRVLPVLLAGVEGATTGAALTAPGEDPIRESWQSALGFMAAHTLFGLAGAGLKGIGKGVSRIAGRETATLGDVLEGDAKEAFNQKLEELQLGIDGKHFATPEEEVETYKKVYKEYASVAGTPGLRAMAHQALDFAHVHGGSMDTQEFQNVKQMLLNQDRARWNPVFNAMAVLQRLSESRDIGFLDEASTMKLLGKHDAFIADALNEVPQSTVAQAVALNQAREVAKTPGGQDVIKKKASQMRAADAKTGMNQNKPDSFYEQRAQKWYEDQNRKGAQRVAKQHAENPAQEVKAANAKRKDVVNPIKVENEAADHVKVRSEYEYDEKGKVTGYSMRMAKEYKVYAAKAAKAQGFGNLKEWFRDLSNEDFMKDLEEWFYPKDLADGGFYFEHEGRSGESNPNFLAFMYNYADHMPPEMKAELEQRLTDEPKVSQHINGKVEQERVLRYYALQMWNHVDDFLGALPQLKDKTNVWRSSFSDMLNPTKYQRQLLTEKMVEESRNITQMYRRKPDVLKAIEKQYNRLAVARYRLAIQKTAKVSADDVERASHIQELNREIGHDLTATGDREMWRF